MIQSGKPCLCALLCLTVPAIGQTTVEVNAGEALAESDLLNGEFQGQLFDLDPDTIFQIRTGGSINPLGNIAGMIPFNFGGATVNLESNAHFSDPGSGGSLLSNVTMNSYASSPIWGADFTGSNAEFNIHGTQYTGQIYDGATVNISAGSLVIGIRTHSGSIINATGGVLHGLNIQEGSTLNTLNAAISTGFIMRTGGLANLSNTSVGNGVRIQSSTLIMDGGSFGNDASIGVSSQVKFSNTTVGDDLNLLGSNLEIINSTIGDNFILSTNSNVVMRSGRIGNHAVLGRLFNVGSSAGTLTMYGGSVGERLTLTQFSTLNMYGGTISDALIARSGSEVNLFVTDLFIDDVEIDLVFHQEFLILQRDGALLEATLSDGTFFDLTLNHLFVAGEDQLTNNVWLTVTLVPTPASSTIFASFGLLSVSRRKR